MKAVIFVYFCLQIIFSTAGVGLQNSKIWGPGLEPDKLVLPARYIFLQLYSGDTPLNSSLETAIEFKVNGVTLTKERSCRVWSNILDRKDGSYILRYKLYEPCDNVEIHIKYNDMHIGKSPFLIKNPVYSENYFCPKSGISEWLSAVDCGDVPNQIRTDLRLFKGVNWNELRSKVIKKFNNPSAVSICHYIIKSNKLYRKCYGKYVGFKMFMDSILLSLMRKMNFPDMEFFTNLGDWPLVKQRSPLLPIFSWCGSHDTFDIVMPTYDITESSLENMGRVMLDMLSVQGNADKTWEYREQKLFWRGRDSNVERLKLIDISRDYVDLFNVSLTNFFFYRDQQDKYGPKTEHVSFYKFFDYKYQINIDGTVAAYRFPYLLTGGSLLFKQHSIYYEHFYGDLKEGEHYISVKTDLSNLISNLNWAIDNDGKSHIIAQNAREYANKNLLPKNIFCYHAHLFNEFSKLIVSNVKVLDGMELVPQPEDIGNCFSDKIKDEL